MNIQTNVEPGPRRSLLYRATLLNARAEQLSEMPMLQRANAATNLANDSCALSLELARRIEQLERTVAALTPYVDEADG
ncbi:hypothetical protein G5B38_02385 [Pseudohalocynthiibacter aestuariivivens]|nr:hypothetical protein [Pseudohalocynthiibacter aestuariivivens]QIE44466.1 hypothetical protein G5B38_02385 [Pseudohalocynthiibacter aestuariivivens]